MRICGSGRFVREILLPRPLPCLWWFQSLFYLGLKLLPPQSQWPRGIRRRSAVLLLLGLRVRIPPRAWILLWVVRSVRRSDHSSRRVLLRVVCLEYGLETPTVRSRPIRSVEPWQKKKKYASSYVNRFFCFCIRFLHCYGVIAWFFLSDSLHSTHVNLGAY